MAVDLIRNKKNVFGFTFTEVLVASGLLVIVSGALYGLYLFNLEAVESSRCGMYLQAQARIALNCMGAELRNATRTSSQAPSPRLSIPAAPNNTSIRFYRPKDLNGATLLNSTTGLIEWGTDDPIDYQYLPASKQVVRIQQGITRVVAREVTDLRFSDIAIDPTLSIYEIRIVLTLSKTTVRQKVITLTRVAIVKLRN